MPTVRVSGCSFPVFGSALDCFSVEKGASSLCQTKVKIYWIIGVAALVRVIAIFGEPIHENDFYRYLWDGKVALSGVNPFQFSPGEAADLQQFEQLIAENPEFHSRIGHPDIPTIYPPAAQLVFLGSVSVFGWSVIGLKAIFVIFDLASVGLLLSLLSKFRKNPAWVILYAWNPLVIKEIANSGHYDAVPVFFCLLAFWLVVSTHGSLLLRAALIGIVLALGTLAKYFAVVFLPLFCCC